MSRSTLLIFQSHILFIIVIYYFQKPEALSQYLFLLIFCALLEFAKHIFHGEKHRHWSQADLSLEYSSITT